MFLSTIELEVLTGYRKPALQCRWLARNGYSFDVNARGRPILCRAAYESRHAPKKGRSPSEPNLAALDTLK
jgi:hypothetical protein